MTKPKPHRIRDEQGQTMTEFALVLPVLALFLFGVIQFGVLFNNYITLTDGVRAGARKAAVSRQASNPTNETIEAVKKSAASLNWSDPKAKITVSPGTPWKHGDPVTVRAEYPYKIDLIGFVLAEGLLKSETVERVE
ncbi:MAG: pilus assembly protein [Actinomycetota bacterium]|nr:pilus assembly protein [Actinomycetota bacterium]